MSYVKLDEESSSISSQEVQLPGSKPVTLRLDVAVQHTLFDLGGELSLPGHTLVSPERVIAVENILDELNATLAPLEEFILPGGSRAAALCHVARSTCRRVERVLFSVDDGHTVSDASRQYINRLSDLLFVMARSLNQAAGEPDILWQNDHAA